ncbi:MAG: cysteine peptidase family C39 domain-containing protein [Planctomycetota bacterium]|nr:cysteine peptidase family C39 domain-containing protein [Planctomycetota bacterium]
MPSLNFLLMAGLFALGLVLAKRSRIVTHIVGGVFVVLGFVNLALSQHPEVTTKLFPFADYVFFSDWSGFVAAFLSSASLGLARSRGDRIRASVLSGVLLLLAVMTYAWFFTEAPALKESRFDPHGVCLQTADTTCGPACAVTVLKKSGIETTEKEMAELALSRKATGTRDLGLYRALKLKAAAAGLDVSFVKLNWNELQLVPKPCIIVCVYDPDTPLTTGKELSLSWTPEVGHTVVYFGADVNGRAIIGEPDWGLERWPRWAFDALWTGHAIVVHRGRLFE